MVKIFSGALKAIIPCSLMTEIRCLDWGVFLFGQWLKTQFFSGVLKSERGEKVAASYRDYAGASHSRSVVFGKNSLHVTDQLDGFKKKAAVLASTNG